MKLDSVISFLKENKTEYLLSEPMKNHTSFKIGGAADVFITPKSMAELLWVLGLLKENNVPFFIVGRGSNLLVSDDGIEGAVISLAGIDGVNISGSEITCPAGIALSVLCRKACESGLTGLEFAYGIPGSVGGALFMNAGAYGGEMSEVVSCAECVDENGNVLYINAADMALGYRTSIFKNNGLIITSVTFRLKEGEKDVIEEKMNELMTRRKDKQPLEYPSAGSTFKRPTGYFAGALIEKNNLKGASVGGAAVSEKHAGFVINRGNATFKDVTELMQKIQKTVLEGDGVQLEAEVVRVGRGVKS